MDFRDYKLLAKNSSQKKKRNYCQQKKNPSNTPSFLTKTRLGGEEPANLVNLVFDA